MGELFSGGIGLFGELVISGEVVSGGVGLPLSLSMESKLQDTNTSNDDEADEEYY